MTNLLRTYETFISVVFVLVILPLLVIVYIAFLSAVTDRGNTSPGDANSRHARGAT